MTPLQRYMSRMRHLVHRCQSCSTLQEATRIWNWIDHIDDPEGYWAVMSALVPWAFVDPEDVNSIKFTY